MRVLKCRKSAALNGLSSASTPQQKEAIVFPSGSQHVLLIQGAPRVREVPALKFSKTKIIS